MTGQSRVLMVLSFILNALGTGKANAQTPETFDAWVSFADKGLVTEAQRRAAFRELEAAFDPRALERR